MCNLESAQLQIKLYKAFPDCTSKEVWKSAAPSAITFHVHLNLTAKLLKMHGKRMCSAVVPLFLSSIYAKLLSFFVTNLKASDRKFTCFSYHVSFKKFYKNKNKKNVFLHLVWGETDHKPHSSDCVTMWPFTSIWVTFFDLWCCNSVQWSSPFLTRHWKKWNIYIFYIIYFHFFLLLSS